MKHEWTDHLRWLSDDQIGHNASLSITIPCYENLTTSAGSAKTLMKNFACKEQRSQSVQNTKRKL